MIVMNKILTIIFAITAMMCVTSCSDDDNYYAGTDTIAIISNTASDMPSIASLAKVGKTFIGESLCCTYCEGW